MAVSNFMESGTINIIVDLMCLYYALKSHELIEKLDSAYRDSRTTATLRSTDLAHVILFSSQSAAGRPCEWMGESKHSLVERYMYYMYVHNAPRSLSRARPGVTGNRRFKLETITHREEPHDYAALYAYPGSGAPVADYDGAQLQPR